MGHMFADFDRAQYKKDLTRATSKPPRISKKQQHINGLRFDLDYFQSELSAHAIAKMNGDQYTVWHHGEVVPIFKVRKNIEELTAELNKIFNDKDYKPWKD